MTAARGGRGSGGGRGGTGGQTVRCGHRSDTWQTVKALCGVTSVLISLGDQNFAHLQGGLSPLDTDQLDTDDVMEDTIFRCGRHDASSAWRLIAA